MALEWLSPILPPDCAVLTFSHLYTVCAAGGSLRLDNFPKSAPPAARDANSRLALPATRIARRLVAEALLCACLLPGALLGLGTAGIRLALGKKPFTSMMGAPPKKKSGS